MSALATNSDKPRPIGDRRGTCCSAGGRRRSQDDTQTTSATRLETAAGPAAVPVGGGRAWPGFETTRRAKLAARTASGRAAAHGHTKQPGPTSQARRRPEHQRRHKQHPKS